MKTLKYPDWICHNCGVKYCNGMTPGHRATYHLGDCECCGAKNLPRTETRDYNHFKQWPIGLENETISLSTNSDESTLYDLIDPVLTAFDFAKVQRVMQAIDWKWALIRDGLSVPAVDDLKKRARSLFEGAIRQAQRSGEYPYVMATGGLYVRVWEDAIELDFVLEQSSLEMQDLEK